MTDLPLCSAVVGIVRHVVAVDAAFASARTPILAFWLQGRVPFLALLAFLQLCRPQVHGVRTWWFRTAASSSRAELSERPPQTYTRRAYNGMKSGTWVCRIRTHLDWMSAIQSRSGVRDKRAEGHRRDKVVGRRFCSVNLRSICLRRLMRRQRRLRSRRRRRTRKRSFNKKTGTASVPVALLTTAQE